MKLLRKIGILFVPLYYLITWLRNSFYDLGIFRSTKYDFPVIAVGNLSVGGTGKTPMVEYLIALLEQDLQIATLSRGYKRKKKGFQFVVPDAIARDVGDEPLQFKKKFPNCIVAVDADRRHGIAKIKKHHPNIDVLLLDDAYQHRKVKAGLYILLTAYSKLYTDDTLLPTGDLREPISGAKRAAIVIVTKCPRDLSLAEREKIRQRLQLNTGQSLYFATIAYADQLVSQKRQKSLIALQKKQFTLVTGIANPKPLLDFYQEKKLHFTHLNFPDHHNFSPSEIEKLEKESIIVTTEKDYLRLKPYISADRLWYQSITMEFIARDSIFDSEISNFITSQFRKDLSHL